MVTSAEQIPTSYSSALISLSRELFQAAQEAPVLDPTFAFPYEAVSQALKKNLKIEKEIALRLKKAPNWVESDECKKLIAESASELYEFTLNGVSHPFYISFPTSFYKALFSHIFGASAEALSQEYSSASFLGRFEAFALAQGIQALRSIPELKVLNIGLLRIVPQEEKLALFQETVALVTTSEISIEGEGAAFPLLSFATPSFLKAFKELRKPTFEKEKKEICESISVPISIELGRSFISLQEIKEIRPGDLFLVEHPFYTPGSEKARVILTYNGKPIFRGKLKDNSLKILEMPFIPEVFTYAGNTLRRPNEPVKATGQEQITNNEPSDNHSPDGEDFSNEDKTAHGDEMMTNKEVASEHEEQFDLEKNPFEGEDPFDNDDLASSETETQQPNEQEIDKASIQASAIIPEKIDINTIPQTVVVQLTQLNMTLDQLSKLTPGNVVDLNIDAQHPVSLVIHDRVIAIGELVLLGDHVGVRIKDIGFTS